MRKSLTITILLASAALSACGDGGDKKYASGDAGVVVTWPKPQAAQKDGRYFKSDLEKRDFTDVKATEKRIELSDVRNIFGSDVVAFSRTDDGFVVTVSENALFTYPSVSVDAAKMPRITKLAAAMLRDPSVSLDVIAHHHYLRASSTELIESERRAVAVQASLMSRSVPASRVRAIGAGAVSDVAAGTSPVADSQNRRIDLHFRRG